MKLLQCWAPTCGREQLELFLAPTPVGELWQTSRESLQSLGPQIKKKHNLQTFSTWTLELSTNVYLMSVIILNFCVVKVDLGDKEVRIL